MVESPERIAGDSSVLEPLDFQARLWMNENTTLLVFDSQDVARVDHYYFVHDAGGWAVPLTLTRDAAKTMQEMAREAGAISDDPEIRDEHRLGMFFNGIEVYNASFSEGLAEQMRSNPVSSILAITGGPRQNQDAQRRAEELWINLEASFPTKLRTAGEGQIPPTLGRDFARQVAAAAGAALVGVCVVIYLRYRRPRLVLAIVAVSLSEVLIILGFAVLIGWYLDLASVAGIIAVIGTGVDHQIVITDEAVYEGVGRKRLVISTRISRAFFIIFTAAATTIIAMTPLAYVGLGRLRGFAIVTIIGVLSGVIITRPAYGRIVRRVVGGR
jgi:preprotein translocase subunit SecD